MSPADSGREPDPTSGEIDPGALDDTELIDLLTMLERQKRSVEAAQLRVLAVLEGRDHSELQLAQEAVSLALTIPIRTAQLMLKRAATLVRELPSTVRVLQRGDISARHAHLLCEAAWRIGPAQVPALEEAVLARAGEQTPTQFARVLRRAELRLDPATAEQRHQRALAERTVGYQPIEDGMTALPIVLGAPEAQLIYTRLTAAASLLPAEDPRTLDQKRADLLVDAILTGLPADELPRRHGRRPSIQVVVSANTLLGLDEEPGHLDGYGPITASTTRRLAADESGTWRRLLTDPDTGQLLDIGADRYRPPQRLRDYIAARDGTCAFPTCSQPAHRCEHEHITPRAQGGPTTRANSALACRRHNETKNNTGWHYRRDASGTFTWVTASGHSYTGRPPERWQSNITGEDPGQSVEHPPQ